MNRILNRRSRTLHRLPAWESCNTDQITDGYRYIARPIHPADEAELAAGPVRPCRRCFPHAGDTHA